MILLAHKNKKRKNQRVFTTIMLPCTTDKDFMTVQEASPPVPPPYCKNCTISSIFPRNEVAGSTVWVHEPKLKQRPQSPDSLPQSKSVAFASHAHVRDIPVLNRHRRHELWWTRREIQSIRALERHAERSKRWEEHSSICMNDYDEEEEEDRCNEYIERAETSSHGLYTHLREERRGANISKSRKAVLREWERQQQFGVCLPEYIAIVYIKCTRSSKREACLRGASLALELQQQQQHQRQRSSSLSTTTTIPITKSKKSRWLASLSPPRSPIRKREV